jgi:hypothetical protein
MKLIAFDGSPEEFASVSHLFAGSSTSPICQVSGATSLGPNQAASKPKLDELTAEKALTRIGLSKLQASIVKAIRASGAKGATSADIAAATGFDQKSVRAGMRGFGKRITHTEGWPKGVEMFERIWEGTQNRYRLHPAVETVLAAGKVKL